MRRNTNCETARTNSSAPLLLLHVRQDLKLVVFLLAGILVMLGVVADVLVDRVR